MFDTEKRRNILGGHRILLFGILCLFGICAAQVRPTNGKQKKEPQKTKVYLLHSDILRFNKEQNPDAQILVGNVRFRHDSAYMDCDSAYFYEARNSFEAFGNIKMQQGDTLFIYGDWLYYDGNSQIAMLRENVKMQNRNTILTTDSLNYDRVFNLGYFFEGGTLTDEENILTSDWGEYSPATKNAVFNYDVKLVNPKFTLTSDTLRYNSQTKIANIVGPSDIVSDQNHIYSELGFYNTTSGEAILLQRSVLTNQQRQLVGDSLFYNRNKGYGEAFRNVVMTDTENKNLLTGEYGFYDELKGNALVTDSALAINYSQNNDSLYMHGDTLRLITYNMNTDSVYRKTFVYHKVRIYKSDLQGVCDSLVFNSQDSCMTMYHDPIVWNGKQQLFGEEIRAYMNDSTIDWAHIINQAMSIEQMDSVHYNQVSGKEIKAYFTGGDLRQVDVIGNVRLGYFPVDGKDSTLIGYITAESSLMNVYLLQRKVQKIKMTTQTDGVMYPMLQIPEDKLYLPSFAWFDYIRPLNKDDVFRWRGKKAGQELKKSVQRKPPLPTLKGLLKK
ncbi:OstA-like protein [Bacteroides sp. Marseille-P3684]|uniref:OstA-like protein n=1 Tax=Bacteroides sp. Marseille-P3684 TaxID=2086579 RepID=UPI000D0ACE67|nr:OstA-like protein [Bacteroides sp. Marseille-P3684]